MGVSGSGKTTIGEHLAADLGWAFYDGDDFHPDENIEKMRSGLPLSDADRVPWLTALRNLIAASLNQKRHAVLACSALKASYRAQLLIDDRVILVYLKGDPALIKQRLRGRQGHFMKSDMLASQLADLEEPESGFRVDIAESIEQIVRNVKTFIKHAVRKS